MSADTFCTRCGTPRASGSRFCTSCGAPQDGTAAAGHAGGAAARATVRNGVPLPAVIVGTLLLIAGGVAAFFALRTPTEVPRAVPGSPGGPPGASAAAQAPGGQGGQDGLPSGHPSIDLPKEVLDFLDGLTADADKNPQSVDAWQKLARARYRASVINGSYRASAEQALDKLMALDPANAEGLRISANLSYDSGDFPEAEKRFQAFLAKYPDDPSAITDLGSTQLFQDHVDDAIATYQKAIAKDAKFMQAHFNLAIALQKQGKKDDAIASLHRAMDLADDPDERQHVENALAEMEGREPQKIAGAHAEAMEEAGGAPPGQGAGMPGGAPGGMPGSAPGGMQGGMPGGMPGGAPGGMPGGGMPMPPPAPDRDVPTNATSDFQRAAEKPLIMHPIVGPRVVRFEWKSATAGSVRIADFPMDRMPPFARDKFKSGMAAKIGQIAATGGIHEPVTIDLVDDATGKVMDTLQGSAGATP